MMHCTVCSRNDGAKLSFYCPACARYSLYEHRIGNARALLARESTDREVANLVGQEVSSDGTGHQKSKPGVTAQRWEIYKTTNQRQDVEDRTRNLKIQAESLRREIQQARSELSRLKSRLDRRRADYASATHNLVARRKSALESVDKSIKRTVFRADQQHQRMAESRIFLCREAAKLYGLRQRRRNKGETVRDEYVIGGVGIVDLKDLNRTPR